jgi:hypothetical protein
MNFQATSLSAKVLEKDEKKLKLSGSSCTFPFSPDKGGLD